MSETQSPTVALGGNVKMLGFITLILGILALLAPMIVGKGIAVLVGFFVLLAGVVRLVWAFQSETFGKGAFFFVIGGLTLLCGLAMVTDPIFASGVLTIILAIYFLLDGGFEVAAALTRQGDPGWVWLLFGGVISILLGLMIWSEYPLSGAWAIGILLGIKLILIGVLMIALGNRAGEIGQTMNPDKITIDV